MTKAEARKAALAIVDRIVSLAGDIRRENVHLSIVDSDIATDDEANVGVDTVNGIYTITLYITPDSDEAYVRQAVCHEMAHICTWEFRHYQYLSGDDDDDSILGKIANNYDEKMAYRIGNILTNLLRGKQ
jgi:uncharacterized protein YjaZ